MMSTSGRTFFPSVSGQAGRRIPSPLKWLAGGLALLLLLGFLAAFLIDKPLRRVLERRVNAALDGYSVQLGGVDFHPIGLSLTLYDLVLRQEAHPEPAIGIFPRIDASVHWRELFTGNLVADWRFLEPQLHIDLGQLKAENEDETPVEERGWQDAIRNIYPLKINRLEIRGGALTYIDRDPDRPLRLTKVDLTATNIRNIRSPERTYPSPFRLEADIFDRGHGLVEGEADLLAKPHPGINARFRLADVPLERLGLVTSSRASLHLAGGILAGAGRIEYAPAVKTAHLAEVSVAGLRADYVHSAATAAAERKRAEKVKETAKKAAEDEEFNFRLDRLDFTDFNFGFVNEAEDPDYRLFLSQADLRLRNLSNRFRAGEAEARLEGQFMGSGDTQATAAFRPEKDGADFDLMVRIDGTRMTEMNDLLRAHAGIDVVTGSFSLYSEVRVQGRQIDGYVKAFFKDLDIYDPQQEKEQGVIGKIKEGVAGALGQILENPQEQVATRVDLSGTVRDPEASSWQIVLELIRNAFFDAILPGFERQAGEKESD